MYRIAVAPDMRILIAGGGIGGITTALALRQHGFSVEVFEQADGFDEVGAGVQLSPNAMHILKRLGLYSALVPLAAEPLAATIRHYRTGKIYKRQDLRQHCRLNYNAPYFQFFRPDLMRCLMTAAHEAGVQINFGQRITHYSQDSQAAYIQLEGGRTPAGDIVIAADGINSVIRQQMLGSEPLRFGGAIAWRGVIDATSTPINLPPEATIWSGYGQHFVAYYMRGTERINFVAVQARKHHDTSDYKIDDIDNPRFAFRKWDSPVRDILAAGRHTTLWGLYDRPPAPMICDGRIALLGDAAHAALPFAAQGAAMAIEDAATLATALSTHKNNPAAGLLHYQRIRQPRTAYINKTARRALRLYHSAPLIKQTAFAALRFMPFLFTQPLDKIYGYIDTQESAS